jgi:hypothetical protein
VKNTECFDPMTKPVDVRISYDLGKTNVSSKFVDECKKSHKYNKEVDKQKKREAPKQLSFLSQFVNKTI